MPIALGLAIANGAVAAEWTTSAGVAPAITYTDNVCLSKDNQQDQWIALVTPDVGIQANGNRANLSLSASMEFNSLSDSKLEDLGCNAQGFGNDRKQYSPELTGTADAILVEQWFFIESTANVYQNEVTPFASGGGDSLDRTGNTNTTYDYTISPYLLHRFKDSADLSLRYTWDDQYNSQDIVGDSSQQSVAFLLSSVPGVAKFSWGVQGDYSKTSYSDTTGSDIPGLDNNNDDSELKSAQLNLGYQLNRYWQVNGFVGNEWNDFVSSRDDIDGDYWDAGVRWTPNVRTTVEAGNGNRFFGDSPRFSISYRHKRSTFSADYSKELTYDRDIRALGSDQPSGGINPGQTTFSRGPSLDERFTLGYAFDGRRFGFGLNAFQSEQTREEQRTEDILADISKTKYRGVSANANHSLSRNLTLSAGLTWSEQRPEDTSNDIAVVDGSEAWVFNLGVQRQLGLNTNLSLDYTYTDRQSENSFDEYTENRFILTLRMGF